MWFSHMTHKTIWGDLDELRVDEYGWLHGSGCKLPPLLGIPNRNTRTSSQLWIVCHILVANPEPTQAMDGEFPLSQVEKEMISRFPSVT